MSNSVEYNHEYYLANQPGIISNQRLRVIARVAIVNKAKDKPCSDCKVKYAPHIMQFDHVRGEKKFTIGEMVHKRSIAMLVEEISKCEVVCANCHADRTYQRRIMAMSSNG